MAATANATIKSRAAERADYPIAATTHIYQSQLTFLDSSGNLSGSVNSGLNQFAGVAVEEVDNSGGQAGDERAAVYQSGAFLLTGSGFAAGDVGKSVFATDSNTISLAAAGRPRVGTIVEYVSATLVWVKLEVHQGKLVPWYPTAAAEAKSGAGAINVTSYYTALTSTGAQATTLANGTRAGQMKRIQMVVDAGDSTLTPVSLSGATTIVFADVGDFVELMWDGAAWLILQAGNDADGATAPVAA
ncbi:hypothetical protein SH661x_000419 [Planctomicrobium sp. SH661]|uniref:hypothetical protein n=1 Tax=Planctomicrobium sp. SH661 TaxID=3448124 RepID=UPI003F5C3627